MCKEESRRTVVCRAGQGVSSRHNSENIHSAKKNMKLYLLSPFIRAFLHVSEAYQIHSSLRLSSSRNTLSTALCDYPLTDPRCHQMRTMTSVVGGRGVVQGNCASKPEFNTMG